jgi:2-alkenal reductase
MKQRLSILFLTALAAVFVTGCSLRETAETVAPIAEAVATAVEAELQTAELPAEQTAVQPVAQTQPEPSPSAEPVEEAQPPVVEAVPVDPTDQERLYIDLYNRVNPGVVSIYMQLGGGSGFIIDSEGYIVTNNHVIAEGGEITVRFHDGDTRTAELVGTDPQADIALLKVDAAPGELTALPLGDSNALQVGQLVVAIGSPFGLANTMTTGIVSGLSRALPTEELGLGANFQTPDVIQTDAAINPGNSGGPLLNLDGEVVGVNTAIESPVRANSGVGFAVPSNVVGVVTQQLRESGRVSYPWLGIAGGTLTPEGAEELGLPRDTRGVVISEVTPGGPAATAGLRGIDAATGRGADVVTGVDGLVVDEFDDLLGYIVQQTTVGQSISLEVLRDGQTITISLTLGDRADAPQPELQQN